jgi:hypothetical protein
LNGTLQILFYSNNANLFGENKHTFSEGNGRWAILVASKELSLVANEEVKVGKVFSTKLVKEKGFTSVSDFK